MKAISVKQPWAYLICAGVKDIENRTWQCPKKYIGKRVLIHASGTPWPWQNTLIYLSDAMKKVFLKMGFDGIWLRNLQTSAIIGSVEIVDCVQNHPSIWAEKTEVKYLTTEKGREIKEKPIYNWVLANAILFHKPIPAKGKLSFWDYPDIHSEPDGECECTNSNTYGLNEYREGCKQNCDECDYYQSIYKTDCDETI